MLGIRPLLDKHSPAQIRRRNGSKIAHKKPLVRIYVIITVP